MILSSAEEESEMIEFYVKKAILNEAMETLRGKMRMLTSQRKIQVKKAIKKKNMMMV